ncbi:MULTISPECIES: alanine dehydrogenase [Pseudanabaena]|uniref:Alanine dehydrogenase n=2 Tax=Pseudanabaena TaxID=1152 RepID=L8MYU3_9CYAN|nr:MULTISPECIES: alanine dehydrogenase [Pseudanabaena]ELS31143.1 alanine dehydrogenase [Pseudanabaena biceps PCC 7429]MDG3496593.1 alanine dehydrogenase [Pseudanabaena catenata USMAC16]
MKIGIPKEIKDREFRVGMTPAGVAALTARSHQVMIETNAGVGSGFSNDEYIQAGGKIVNAPEDVYSQEMVIKVKEPLPSEYALLHSQLILFTYLHLAADRQLTEALIQSGSTCIAYETVQLDNGQLPLLVPMSIIAGRLSVQFGAHYLTKQQGGSGVLLGGIPGVRSGHVVVLGGGVVGTEAARMAIGLGARVTILDVNLQRLGELEALFGSRVQLLYSTASNIAEAVTSADLVIGAVLVAGKRAPTLVKRELVQRMRSHSVIVDVAVDQGGCIETVHPTSHTVPVYEEAGILHYGVPNMPGAVPWTATQALVNATLPYACALADFGLEALGRDRTLAQGLNIQNGRIVYQAVAEAFPDLPTSIRSS